MAQRKAGTRLQVALDSPAGRSIWTSGWVGTPALIAAVMAVVAIYNLIEHRWMAAAVYGAAALALLLSAVVSRRAQSR